MKTYIFSTCRREQDGTLTVLDLKTPPTPASSRGEALELLKGWFETNTCLPYREVS